MTVEMKSTGTVGPAMSVVVLAQDDIGCKPTLKEMTDGTYECLLHQYKYLINAEELNRLWREIL
jgi:hypothetical protein